MDTFFQSDSTATVNDTVTKVIGVYIKRLGYEKGMLSTRGTESTIWYYTV